MGALIVGNGYFKANISTIVGKLYEDDDPRRDSGFTIFYIGINIGALLATTVWPMSKDLRVQYGFGRLARHAPGPASSGLAGRTMPPPRGSTS